MKPLSQNSRHDAFQDDGGQAPLVHHFAGAVARAAARAIEGHEIHAAMTGQPEQAFDVLRVVARHFEVDILHAELPQMVDAGFEIALLPHGQTPKGVKSGTCLFAPSLLHGGVGGVGQHQKAALFLTEGLLQSGDAIGGLGSLGRLAEFEFNGLCAALLNGVVCHPLKVVVKIGLQDDLTVAAVIAGKGAEHLAQLWRVDDSAVFIGQCGIFAHGALADDGDDAGHGGACKIVLPVELDDGGQQERKRQPDGVCAANLDAKPHMVDAGEVGVFRRAHRAKHAAVDVEMGVIHRVAFFRGDLIVSCGVWVDHFHAPHCGEADLTGAEAVGRAHGAHARKGARMRGVAHGCAIETGAEQRAIRHVDTPFR